jgi:hypothetical protein
MKSLPAYACIALLLLCAAPLAAQNTYRVIVDHSGSSLTFQHPDGHGNNGNQYAKTHDIVQWRCGSSLQRCTVTVTFKDGNSPCSAAVGPSTAAASCTITAGAGNSGYVGTYKYTITVSSNGANYETDPEIIINNSAGR